MSNTGTCSVISDGTRFQGNASGRPPSQLHGLCHMQPMGQKGADFPEEWQRRRVGYGVPASKRAFAGSVWTLGVPSGSTHGHGRSPKNAGFSPR